MVLIGSTMSSYTVVGSKPEDAKANLYSSHLIFTKPDLHHPFSLAFAYTSMILLSAYS